MPHSKEAYAEARTRAVVLAGETRRTVDPEGYLPDAEALAAAGGKRNRIGWRKVTGPYLRRTRRKARSNTGVVGISLGRDSAGRRCLHVRLGSTTARVNVDALGPTLAWRRAVELRAAHEQRVAEANAAIVAARLGAEGGRLKAEEVAGKGGSDAQG